MIQAGSKCWTELDSNVCDFGRATCLLQQPEFLWYNPSSIFAATIEISLVEISRHVCCSNLDVFGGELRSNNGFTGTDLAECMIYRRRTWQGILPVNHLAQWALSKQVSRHAHAFCMLASLQLGLLQSALRNVHGYVCKSVQVHVCQTFSATACFLDVLAFANPNIAAGSHDPQLTWYTCYCH